MADIHAILVDSNGDKLRFINAEVPPAGFSVGDGQQLIYADIGRALLLVKPRWTGRAWVEAATQEEIAAWEAAKPEPEPAPSTQTELLTVEFSAALAAIRLETDLALAEMTTLLAAGMEG